MKITSLIASVVLAGSAISGAAFADDRTVAPKDVAVQPDKATTKPHSHVQEKTGIPEGTPSKNTDKRGPAKDMSKHYHPRDNK